MPEFKLHYFDFTGGRGEVARLLMRLGEIEFVDERIAFADWPAVRETMPLRAVPVLEVDGEKLTQSNTINRYLGRLVGLYPDDPLQGAFCDEVMDSVEDILTRIVPTLFIADEAEKKAAREKLAAGPIPLFLKRLQDLLDAHGGECFADSRMTVADLKVYFWIRHLTSGNLDHVPTSIVATEAPRVLAHYKRIDSHPVVRAHCG